MGDKESETTLKLDIDDTQQAKVVEAEKRRGSGTTIIDIDDTQQAKVAEAKKSRGSGTITMDIDDTRKKGRMKSGSSLTITNWHNTDDDT